jgi:hypothetical protein
MFSSISHYFSDLTEFTVRQNKNTYHASVLQRALRQVEIELWNNIWIGLLCSLQNQGMDSRLGTQTAVFHAAPRPGKE